MERRLLVLPCESHVAERNRLNVTDTHRKERETRLPFVMWNTRPAVNELKLKLINFFGFGSPCEFHVVTVGRNLTLPARFRKGRQGEGKERRL